MLRLLFVFIFALSVQSAWADEPKSKPKQKSDNNSKAEKKKNADDKAEDKGEKEDKIRAVVFLCKEYKPLEIDDLKKAFTTVYPNAKVGTDDKDEISITFNKLSSVCALDNEKTFLIINSMPNKYVREEDLESTTKNIEKGTGDKELARKFSEHKAWFSVDIFKGKLTEKNEKKHYDIICRIAMQFKSDNHLLAFFPEKNRLLHLNEVTLKAMESGEALHLINDSIINVKTNDEAMKQAEEDARKNWNQFKKAFDSKSGKGFMVKCKFTQKIDGEDSSEHMWIEVTSINEEVIKGVLNNSPNFLTNVKLNDEVKINTAEIEDWLFIENGEMTGGFTIKVLEKMQKERKKQVDEEKSKKEEKKKNDKN